MIPKTKLSPNDFINVMKNILTHNEIKKQNIIRKDYIAKALANIALELEENDLEWLKYDQFKIKLKNLLEEEEQGKNNVNIITEMIDKLDLLEENESNIEESNKIKSEEENSELEDEISNLNENNNDINNKNVDNIDLINEEEEKKDNNNLENENEIDNNSNISETNNINSIDELCSNYELHKASLLDRLLINNNLNESLKNIILECKKNFGKRIKVTGESDDDEYFEKLMNKTKIKKIRYPKK